MIYPTLTTELKDGGWYMDFLRENPKNKQGNFDLNYIINQSECHNYFYKWLINEFHIDYVKMLMNQHQIACLGIHNDRPYKIKGYWRGGKEWNNIWVERNSYPGQLRSALKSLNIKHCDIDYIEIEKEECANLRSESYFDEIFNIEKQSFYYKKRQGSHGTLAICTIVEGEDFLFKKQFRFSNSDCYFKMKHASGSDYLLCQYAVAKLMLNVKEDLHSLITSYNPEMVLNTLSRYYHNAINWMPFAHVNNSLFMGQINVILRLCSMQSIPHGRLDSLALVSSTSNFEKIFTNYYSNQQNR